MTGLQKGGENKQMNKKSIIITIVAIIVVAAVAFLGGMKYQQSKSTSNLTSGQFLQGNQRFGQGGMRFGSRAGMATIGKVVSSDSNSITVQLQDGSSKIINISGSTKIVKTSNATITDLGNGTEVAVFGTTNSDGSVTAQNIQINPTNIMRFERGSTPQPTQGQ